MSRSYKKTNICGYSTSVSDKPGKRQINSRLRMKEKLNIHRHIDDFEGFVTTHKDDVEKYSYLPKDGKQYIHMNGDPVAFRKSLKK